MKPIGNPYTHDFLMDVALDRIHGMKSRDFVGHNPDIDIGLDASVWPFSNNMWVRPTTPTTFYLSSTSASDTANTFLITVLGANYFERQEIVTPTGQTPVAIGGGTCLRVIDVINISAQVGATVPTLGDLYIASESNHTAGVPNDATKVQGKISLRNAVSSEKWRCGYTTVPAGKSAQIYHIMPFIGKNKEATINWYAALNTATVLGVPLEFMSLQVYQNAPPVQIYQAMFPEFTDIFYTVTSDNNNSSVDVLTQMILVDNNIIQA